MRMGGMLSMRRTDLMSSLAILSRGFASVRPCIDAPLLQLAQDSARPPKSNELDGKV